MSEDISAGFARRIISSLGKLDTIIGDLDIVLSDGTNFTNENVRDRMVKDVGELLLVAYEIREPIVHFYPDLDPYKDSS